MTDKDTPAAADVLEGESPSLQHANGHSIEQERPTTGIAGDMTQTEENVKEDQSEVITEEKIDEAEEGVNSVAENIDEDDASNEGKCQPVLSSRKNYIHP